MHETSFFGDCKLTIRASTNVQSLLPEWFDPALEGSQPYQATHIWRCLGAIGNERSIEIIWIDDGAENDMWSPLAQSYDGVHTGGVVNLLVISRNEWLRCNE